MEQEPELVPQPELNEDQDVPEGVDEKNDFNDKPDEQSLSKASEQEVSA